MFFVYIFLFSFSFGNQLFCMENSLLPRHNTVDYFSRQPDDMIFACVGLEEKDVYKEIQDIERLKDYADGIIPDNIMPTVQELFTKVSSRKDVNALALTSKHLNGVFQKLLDAHRDFWKLPFNIDAFCKNPIYKTYIYDWYVHFYTGICCLEQQKSLLGFCCHKPTTEVNTGIEKNFFQANYIRFDDQSRLTLELGKKYMQKASFNNVLNNVLFKRLKKMVIDKSLTIDSLIALISELNALCHVCNSVSQPKIFPGSEKFSYDKKGVPCSCALLINTLQSIRSLFNVDQSLPFYAVADGRVIDENGVCYRRRLIAAVQLPIDATIPFKFCKDIGLLKGIRL